MTIWEIAALSALILVNIVGFAVCAADKHAAIRNKRRVRESTLFLLALFGGAAGVYISMMIFRHKTRKMKFKALIPVILCAQAALILWIIFQNR